MFKSKATFEMIGNFCADIVERKNAAVKMMITDLEVHFGESKEELEPFDEERCGVIAISYIKGEIAFVFENGDLIYANTFDASDFDLVFCVWMAFHEE